ncbi:MAG TPA: class I SAM-dependent methyltransferase [Gammaproteobacteria bacterium]|nr:class I SAM-dependent methyltransferase [Gammaproteobacteria bacterium]
MATAFVHRVRSDELDLALPYLPARGRVLELGAGDGWQAQELARRGLVMTAVDVRTARRPAKQFFPVVHYDGRSLPFPDQSFDAIYSSSVLEHIVDFEFVQGELARVLRPGGVAVHCVPSGTWRFWTSASHPVYAAQWGLRWLRGSVELNPAPATESSATTPAKSIWHGLLPPRHGEHGSLLSEHWLFSRNGWSRRFRETNWRITALLPTQLFYTGNEVFGLRLGSATRHRLAALLGSSTLIYVLAPGGTA